MIKSHVDPHNINIVWITLPSKDGWENRVFLQKYGIDVLRGDSTFFPSIHSGAILKHESGIICKVREVMLQHCGRGSSCSRIVLKATNASCDKKKFQEVFYDFFGNLIR